MSVQELEAYHDLKAKPFYKDAKLIGKVDSYPIGFNEAYVYELQLLNKYKERILALFKGELALF